MEVIWDGAVIAKQVVMQDGNFTESTNMRKYFLAMIIKNEKSEQETLPMSQCDKTEAEQKDALFPQSWRNL